MLDPWMKRRNGSDMPVKVFMFFFLLSSCYLLVFLSSLSALTQACRHSPPCSFFLYPPYPSFIYPPFSLGHHTHFLIQACRDQASSITPTFLPFILHPTPPLTWSLTGACHPSLLHIPIKATHSSPHIHATHTYLSCYS